MNVLASKQETATKYHVPPTITSGPKTYPAHASATTCGSLSKTINWNLIMSHSVPVNSPEAFHVQNNVPKPSYVENGLYSQLLVKELWITNTIPATKRINKGLKQKEIRALTLEEQTTI